MNMHEFKSVRMMARTSVSVVKGGCRELQVVEAFRKVMLQEAIRGGVTSVAESELPLIAPPGSGGHSPFLVACLASPSAAFDGIVGYLHPLGSAGTIGLGPTSILAGVVATYELLSKLNSELFHCLLPPCSW